MSANESPNNQNQATKQDGKSIIPIYSDNGEEKLLVPVKKLGVWIWSFLGIVGIVLAGYVKILVTEASLQEKVGQAEKSLEDMKKDHEDNLPTHNDIILHELSTYDCEKLNNHRLYVEYLLNNKKCK